MVNIKDIKDEEIRVNVSRQVQNMKNQAPVTQAMQELHEQGRIIPVMTPRIFAGMGTMLKKEAKILAAVQAKIDLMRDLYLAYSQEHPELIDADEDEVEYSVEDLMTESE